MLITGNLVTFCVTTSQKPPFEGSAFSTADLPKYGIRSRFNFGPSSASTAGNSVKLAANATITTRMAPRPSELQDRERHDQQSTECDNNRHSAEKYGPSRRLTRSLDSLKTIQPVLHLFAVSGNDEERIIDADRQTRSL